MYRNGAKIRRVTFPSVRIPTARSRSRYPSPATAGRRPRRSRRDPGSAGDLPLGDPVHRSPTGQYPVPAGEDWSLDARSRVRGPLTGPLAHHMLALPARPALTADSVLRPQRGGRAHCARRVGTPPAIRHSVPAWQCPAESGRGPPRPGNRRSPSEQAPCARLVEPSECRPGDRPPARQRVVSQRSSTLCPPGSDQSSSLADHHQPAKSQAPGDQARVPARE